MAVQARTQRRCPPPHSWMLPCAYNAGFWKSSPPCASIETVAQPNPGVQEIRDAEWFAGQQRWLVLAATAWKLVV